MNKFIEVTLVTNSLVILLNVSNISAVSTTANGTFINLKEGNGTPYSGITIKETYTTIKELLQQQR